MSVDVVVVGGGMTGAAAALALAQAGFTVALADAAPSPEAPAGDDYDLRVSTLTPASARLLQRLGVWDDLAADRVQPFASMRVWEADPLRELVFRASDVGWSVLGHVCENRRVQALLWQALSSAAGVELHSGDAVEDIRVGARGVRLTLASGARLSGRLLVVADGAGSSTRQRLEIGVERFEYGQKGLVAVVATEWPHQATAWQRFLPGGPLAFLPLANGHSSIVWSLPGDESDPWLAEGAGGELAEALETASQGRLGQIRVLGRRAAFPLVRQRARHYVADGVALIGDAAHVIHPLAGQGANLGLLDVASLVEVLEDARDRGLDFGAQGVLRRYERWRRTDNELMAEAMSALRAFYAMDAPPFPQIRELGRGLLAASRWARARLIRHASGFGGQVPRRVAGPTL